MPYLLAHDVGTSGNKATLFDTKGQVVATATCSYEVQWHKQRAEQDATHWYKAVCETTKCVLQSIEAKDIVGLSLSGQMMGCLCVDKHGVALHKAIIWADLRAEKEAAHIRKKIGAEEFYRITGHRPSASYSVAKLLWAKNNVPEVYKQTYKMLQAKDYVILRLTGAFVTDCSDASGTGLCDINTLQWSTTIAQTLRVSLSLCPDIKLSTDVVGTVTKQAAEETGLLQGTPVVCGGGDGPMAGVGAMCTSPGTAYTTVGTSAWNAVTSTVPMHDPDMNTFTFAHIVPKCYMPTGTMQTAGAALDWAQKNIAGANDTEQTPKNKYAAMDAAISATEVGSNGVLFLPYLMGERSPRWNENAKGTFIGLTIETTRGELLRAVYEGVALNLEIILHAVLQKDQTPSLVLTGGGAKSAVWAQIFADVYNKTIEVPDYVEEATSIGAAVTAGVGLKVYSSFEAIKSFVKIVRTFSPIAEHVAAYEKIKGIFDQSYHSLVKVFTSIAKYRSTS